MTPGRPWTVVRDSSAEALWFGGSLLVTRADGAMTGGKLAMFDFSARRRSFAPLHRATHDQVFLLLDGEMQFVFGGERVDIEATSSVIIPAGTTFAHRVSSTRARYLLTTAAAGIEPLFRTGGEAAPVRELPPDSHPPVAFAVLAQAATAGGVEMVGPPPD